MRGAEFLQVVGASRFAFGVLRAVLNHAEILAAVRFGNAGVGVLRQIANVGFSDDGVGVLREWGHSLNS